MCGGAREEEEEKGMRAKKTLLTVMTLQMKTRATNRSPGWEKRLESTSKALQYVNKKYGSMIRPSEGPLMKKPVTSRQT